LRLVGHTLRRSGREAVCRQICAAPRSGGLFASPRAAGVPVRPTQCRCAGRYRAADVSGRYAPKL